MIYRLYTCAPNKYAQGNMGLAWWHGRLIGACRCTTNIAIGGRPHFSEEAFRHGTTFLNSSMVKIGYLNPKNKDLIYWDSVTLPVKSNYKGSFRGLEDPRLVVWDDKLYIYGTLRTEDDPQGLIIHAYELDENFNIIDEIAFSTKHSQSTEKNWMAIPDKVGEFVYCISNSNGRYHTVLYSDPNPDPMCKLRGSTPLVKTKHGYITIMHESQWYSDWLDYNHRLVFFDKKCQLTTYSSLFNFEQPGIEFCTGMTMDDKDNLWIAYSTTDGTVNLYKTDLKSFEQQAENEIIIKDSDSQRIAHDIWKNSPITASQYYWNDWVQNSNKDSLYSHYAILLYYLDRYLIPDILPGLEDDNSIDAIILKTLHLKRIHAPWKVYYNELHKLPANWKSEIRNQYILLYRHYDYII